MFPKVKAPVLFMSVICTRQNWLKKTIGLIFFSLVPKIEKIETNKQAFIF